MFGLAAGLTFHLLDLLIVKGDNLSAVQHPQQNTVIIILYHRQAVDIFDGKLLKYGIKILGRRGCDNIKSGNIPHYDKVSDAT